jgi:hypothetical protein
MKITSFMVISLLLLAITGVATATTPPPPVVTAGYYSITFPVEPYCDTFVLYASGPSNRVNGTYNFVTGYHDYTNCQIGYGQFPAGGFEVYMAQGQYPNDAFGSNRAAVDVSSTDVSIAVIYAFDDAFEYVFDVGNSLPRHPDSFAIYDEDGFFDTFIDNEGPATAVYSTTAPAHAPVAGKGGLTSYDAGRNNPSKRIQLP